MQQHQPENDQPDSTPRRKDLEKQVVFTSQEVVMTMVTPDPHCSSEDSTDFDSSQVCLAKANPSSNSSICAASKESSSTPVQKDSTKYNYCYMDNGLPVHHGHSNPQLQLWWNVCCWTVIALLSVGIVLLLSVVLTWCVVRPRRPDLQIRSINVQSIAVISRPDIPAADLSANVTIDFLAKNPNRVATAYSSTSVSLFYQGTVVAQTSMLAFSQEAHSVAPEKVNMLIEDVRMFHSNALDLLTDFNIKDSVSLKVVGRVQARLQILGLSTPPVKVNVWCSIEIKVSEQKVYSQQCH